MTNVVGSAAHIRLQIEMIAQEEGLQKDLEILPKNYTFEIPKTIWKIRSTNSKTVALQFPEGLLMYSCVIADILTKYTGVDVIIMGDVTYGACCVDDFTGRALGCDLLVHYGHSCLVPIHETKGINLLYIFVNIDINLSHFLEALRRNFKKNEKLAIVSTVQFIASLQAVKRVLNEEGFNVVVPQCSPLSPGEILGCTSPILDEDINAIVYLGDGRFHLESIMIHNPKIPAFQYNPYSRQLTSERYGHEMMVATREKAIETAKCSSRFGLILGTLGRQGSLKIYEELEKKLLQAGKGIVRVLLSEIFAGKLNMFTCIDSWVQVACPRLSIDWGSTFAAPLLTPFELAVALEHATFDRNRYPMDYYAYSSLGPWTNNHESHRPERRARRAHISLKAST